MAYNHITRIRIHEPEFGYQIHGSGAGKVAYLLGKKVPNNEAKVAYLLGNFGGRSRSGNGDVCQGIA